MCHILKHRCIIFGVSYILEIVSLNFRYSVAKFVVRYLFVNQCSTGFAKKVRYTPVASGPDYTSQCPGDTS